MKLPSANMEKERARQPQSGDVHGQSQVHPSDLACDICKAGCSLLSGLAKTACLAACELTVC